MKIFCRENFFKKKYFQIVGVFTEELQAAQQWNGPAVLELLKEMPQ